jgi:hypothetical protein
MSAYLPGLADEEPMRIGVTACTAGGYAEDYPGSVCPGSMLLPIPTMPPPPPPYEAYPKFYVRDPKTGESVERTPTASYEWLWWLGLAVGAIALAAPVVFAGRRK